DQFGDDLGLPYRVPVQTETLYTSGGLVRETEHSDLEFFDQRSQQSVIHRKNDTTGVEIRELKDKNDFVRMRAQRGARIALPDGRIAERSTVTFIDEKYVNGQPSGLPGASRTYVGYGWETEGALWTLSEDAVKTRGDQLVSYTAAGPDFIAGAEGVGGSFGQTLYQGIFDRNGNVLGYVSSRDHHSALGWLVNSLSGHTFARYGLF